jgi:hypothetical protein
MSTVDYSALWTLGCNTGLITPDGEDIVVILDFGPPWFDGVSTYGTRLFNTHEYVSISRIYTATQGFLSGFYNCTYTKPYVHLTVAVGTNNNPNFGGLSADHGIRWARMINDLNDWIDRVPYYSLKLTARGANDIELAFAPAWQTRLWVEGYVITYQIPSNYYNFGACEGCVTTGTICPDLPNDWDCDDVYYVSYGAPPAWPIPEIYLTNGVNAEQWAWMSRWALQNPSIQRPIYFLGSLTQWQACQTNPPCNGTDNRPEQGWAQLYEELNPSPGCGTCQDLQWASDISYANTTND